MRRIQLGAMTVMAIAAISCGGSDGDSGGGGGSSGSMTTSTASSMPLTADQACTDFVADSCDLLDKCSAGLGTTVGFGDPGTCKMRGITSCVDSLNLDFTSSTPASLEACAASLSGQSCEEFWDNLSSSACLPAAGMVAVGGACAADAQCVTSYCKPIAGSLCGSCDTAPAAGAACGSELDCGRGLNCIGATMMTMGTCKAPVGNGSPCAGPLECQSGTACVGADASMGTKGVCKTQATTAGAACDATNKTSANCDSHLGIYCSGDNTCHTLTLSGAGMTCGIIGSGTTAVVAGCKGGALCVVASGQPTGKCVAPAADGATCDATMGPPCLSPARCLSGKCAVPDASMCQ